VILVSMAVLALYNELKLSQQGPLPIRGTGSRKSPVKPRAMTVSLIAAAAENGVIGSKNAMIWRIPEDLAHFRRTTMGHHVVLGRRSYEGLKRPLEGRTVIVLSRRGDCHPSRGAEPGNTKSGEVLVARSKQEALALARRRGEEELFVAGGEQIYRLFLPIADRIYLTRVHAAYQGDAFFPELGPDWREASRREGGSGGPLPITFVLYTRSGRPDGASRGGSGRRSEGG